MRRISEPARQLLMAATAVARFRGAQQCERFDLAIAQLHLSSCRDVSLYADSGNSTSPEQLPFEKQLEDLHTRHGDGEVSEEELLAYAHPSG